MHCIWALWALLPWNVIGFWALVLMAHTNTLDQIDVKWLTYTVSIHIFLYKYIIWIETFRWPLTMSVEQTIYAHIHAPYPFITIMLMEKNVLKVALNMYVQYSAEKDEPLLADWNSFSLFFNVHYIICSGKKTRVSCYGLLRECTKINGIQNSHTHTQQKKCLFADTLFSFLLHFYASLPHVSYVNGFTSELARRGS